MTAKYMSWMSQLTLDLCLKRCCAGCVSAQLTSESVGCAVVSFVVGACRHQEFLMSLMILP